MVREIRCPESGTCNECKSAKGKLLFEVEEETPKPSGIVVRIACPQLRGKLIRVEI